LGSTACTGRFLFRADAAGRYSGTILSYAGIGRGQTVSAGELNDAYQRILASGLFESVELEPRGGTLVISVTEFPTINQISIEGNRRLNNDALSSVIEDNLKGWLD